MSGRRLLRGDADGLCRLTLDRPDKMNALDTPLFEELDAELARLEGETGTVGCVIVGGAGRCFSAGADLAAMGAAPIDPRFKHGVVERLARLPQPTIAAVHGVCYTGGLELALACDFIVADAIARFADTHGRWGLVAAWGMIQRLPRRIGMSAAKRMAMTARTVEAAEAHDLGLIDVLADEGGLDDAAAALARDILATSWHTNRHAKRMMREGEGVPLERALASDTHRYPGYAEDHAERVARFTKA